MDKAGEEFERRCLLYRPLWRASASVFWRSSDVTWKTLYDRHIKINNHKFKMTVMQYINLVRYERYINITIYKFKMPIDQSRSVLWHPIWLKSKLFGSVSLFLIYFILLFIPFCFISLLSSGHAPHEDLTNSQLACVLTNLKLRIWLNKKHKNKINTKKPNMDLILIRLCDIILQWYQYSWDEPTSQQMHFK